MFESILPSPAILDILLRVSSSPLAWLAFYFVGLLYDYLKHQYGTKNEIRAVVLIKFLYVIWFVMVLWTGQIYLPLVGSVVAGWFTMGMLYDSRGLISIGPSEKRIVKTQIPLEGSVITFFLPPENTRNQPWKRDEDNQPRDFNQGRGTLFGMKYYMQQCWSFYSSSGGVRFGNVQLHALVEEMSGFGDLTNVACLNGAASASYFARHGVPHPVPQLTGEKYVYQRDEYTAWRLKVVNGCKVIAYEVSFADIEGSKMLFQHCALSNELMLTIVAWVFDSTEDPFKEAAETFAEKVIDQWKLELSDKKREQNPADTTETVKAPHFDSFDLKIPTKAEYRELFRQHARDQVEWMVFERSPIFEEWFEHQSNLLCAEFSKQRRTFVDRQLDKCFAVSGIKGNRTPISERLNDKMDD